MKLFWIALARVLGKFFLGLACFALLMGFIVLALSVAWVGWITFGVICLIILGLFVEAEMKEIE